MEKPKSDPCLEPVGHGHEPNKNVRPYLIGCIALLIITLFLIGLFPRLTQWKKIEKIADEEVVPTVSTMKAIADKNPIELVLPSITDAIHITPIWARTNGYLSAFLVDIGDIVEEGQLLAEIDTPEIDKELLQAKAQLAESLARLEIARISANRWQNLYKRNSEAVAYQEVDERASTLKSAEADVEAFLANVERLEKVQGFNKIYAPFQGTIIDRNIDIGSLISAGSNNNPQQLFKIAKMDVIRVFVNVPQYFYRLIVNGLQTEVTIREFPSQKFKGTVVRSAGALDPIARTLLTEVHIDNREGLLMAGLYAEVKFSLIPDTEYFIVPTKAVIIHNTGPEIAVLDGNDIVEIKRVKIGRDYGKTIEITSGIQENETLITNPNDKIKPGVRVSVKEAAATK